VDDFDHKQTRAIKSSKQTRAINQASKSNQVSKQASKHGHTSRSKQARASKQASKRAIGAISPNDMNSSLTASLTDILANSQKWNEALWCAPVAAVLFS
jgi:hypothetical protein